MVPLVGQELAAVEGVDTLDAGTWGRGRFMQLRSRQRGVSLIEVLVAIVVFSVGVLGLALMQVKGAQFTREAGTRSTAILQQRSLIDAMRANPEAAKAPVKAADPAAPTADECPYCFDGTTTPAKVDCSSGCTSKQIAKNDLAMWLERLRASATGPLSGVLAKVSWDPSIGMYVITARWSGGQMDQSKPLSASDDLTYTLNYLP